MLQRQPARDISWLLAAVAILDAHCCLASRGVVQHWTAAEREPPPGSIVLLQAKHSRVKAVPQGRPAQEQLSPDSMGIPEVVEAGSQDLTAAATNLSAVNATKMSLAEDAEDVDLEEELQAPLAMISTTTLLFCLVGSLWCCAARSPSGGAAAARPDGASALSTAAGESEGLAAGAALTSQARWLLLLAAASSGLLVLQLLMGSLAHSLTLLADSAHTAADCVSYFFAFFAERAKGGLAKHGTRYVSFVDILSACLSLGVVFVPSCVAMREAAARLGWTGDGAAMVAAAGPAETDFRLMGSALLIFSIASIFVNASLVLAHFRRQSEDKLQAALPPPAPVVQEGEVGARTRSFGAGKRQLCRNYRDSRRSAAGDGPAGSSRGPGSQAQQGSSHMQLLHMAFHPGCQTGCTHTGKAGNRPLPPASPQDDSGAAAMEAAAAAALAALDSSELNLNVAGALLHVCTDVVRSIVIMVVGALVFLRVMSDPYKADAGCAIVVGGCVILGSSAMVYGIVKKFPLVGQGSAA
eukprot:TRINITY_DN75648_c0_g1_i1.p1 TRINITY_DN75648_c0_g1~~TRINITY_DN75648_c0_g1_i1.p1  ORF type:complete len:525 (+),score=128.33 TRINITY_DN75648_c0_g1_i1:100-1674(+)